ncbi:Ig-like domain-containing protein, partial [Psychromonas sp.]|uniref:Ig-like domain-containing protein n=1 Tax=Psychromonas sp. TaxID=1884585 RepID=UPI0035655827
MKENQENNIVVDADLIPADVNEVVPDDKEMAADNADVEQENVELIDPETLQEIAEIQAAIENNDQTFEQPETAAGNTRHSSSPSASGSSRNGVSSHGGSSSAVVLSRSAAETLASTDFDTQGFIPVREQEDEFVDTYIFTGSTPGVSFESPGDDAVYNAAEVGTDGTITSTINIPADTEVGDTLTYSVDNGAAVTVILTAENITEGVSVEVAPGATVTATISYTAGNVSPTGSGTAAEADSTLPTLAISSDNTSDLAVGETAEISFTFSEAVDGFDISDISVAGGTLSGLTTSDNITWTATFTHTSTDTPSITVTDGTYSDLAGNAGTGDALALVADITAPTLDITTDNSSDLAVGETATISFTFSEAVTGFSDGDIVVSGGTLGAISTTDNITWTATFTQSGTDTPSITVADNSYSDLAGNNGTGDALALVADIIAPTLTISSDNSSDLAVGETAEISFTFSEAVTGFDATDITVAGGTLSGLTTTDNITWTATFTQSGTDTPSITVADGTYSDLAGNNGTGDALALVADTSAPTLTISTDNSSDLAVGETAEISFTFSEAVTGFDISDISVAGGTLSGLTSTDNITWTATFTQSGTDTPSITVADNSYSDLAGNAGTGDTLPLVADSTAPGAPTVTITEDTNNDGALVNAEISGNTDITIALPATAVADDTLNVTIDGTTTPVILTAAMITATQYVTSVATPAEGVTLNVSASITDQAGNTSASDADSVTRADETATGAPTVVISEDGNNDGELSNSEISGDTDISIGLPSGAVENDVLNVTIDGVT